MGGSDAYAALQMLTGPGKALNIRVPEELLRRAAEKADEDGHDRAWLVRALLFLYVTGAIDLKRLAREAGL